MNNKETINELSEKIYKALCPFIRESKTILTDLPYHGNIGDTLIWEGEIKFLTKVNAYPLSQTSSFTFTFPKLDEDVIICLHGGGNFGDLYYEAQEFRKRIIKTYPNNKIIIFPQSIWYEDERLIETDSEVFSTHKDLHICARDSFSFDFLKKYFPNCHIYLLPDMAFYIQDVEKYKKKTEMKNVALYLDRMDKESVRETVILKERYDHRDWPSFEGRNNILRIFFGFTRRLNGVRIKPLRALLSKLSDLIMAKIMKPKLIGQGVRLLEPYKKIYTSRLHGMILGLLMDKEVVAFDNITKKLSAYYNTWLISDDNVKLKNL